jgi:AmmeMemoRadiSam system protein B
LCAAAAVRFTPFIILIRAPRVKTKSIAAPPAMTPTPFPAAAARFYPDDPAVLARLVQGLVKAARPGPTPVPAFADESGTESPPAPPPPKAIVVPHAGYAYSGPIAASAYALLAPLREVVRRVVLLGPAHFVPVEGLAVCGATEFATPLGRVPVDVETIDDLLRLPQVHLVDAAHVREHSLEVHLPFLQTVFADFRIVPLAVGRAAAEEVAEVIDRLWGGPETLFVVSSDLSHYHDYETATLLDSETTRAIEEFRVADLRGDRACGFVPLGGLLSAARERGLRVRTVDLRNSGDTAGPRDQVVGYGAYVVE